MFPVFDLYAKDSVIRPLADMHLYLGAKDLLLRSFAKISFPRRKNTLKAITRKRHINFRPHRLKTTLSVLKKKKRKKKKKKKQNKKIKDIQCVLSLTLSLRFSLNSVNYTANHNFLRRMRIFCQES